MKIGVAISILILSCSFSSAQDPGIRDTVSFGQWEAIVPTDSAYTGNIRIPIRAFNDEPLSGVELIFKWSGPWTPVEAKFVGARSRYFYESLTDVNLSFGRIYMGAVALPTVGGQLIPPDTGILGYLCFSVDDTGVVEIDKTTNEIEGYLRFFPENGFDFGPYFTKLENTIQHIGLIPGDVNNNGGLTLADAISLAYYVFKGTPVPPILNLCDVTADCRVNVVDVVYLANTILKSAFILKWGCAC
jgi:hypothetical protein